MMLLALSVFKPYGMEWITCNLIVRSQNHSGINALSYSYDKHMLFGSRPVFLTIDRPGKNISISIENCTADGMKELILVPNRFSLVDGRKESVPEGIDFANISAKVFTEQLDLQEVLCGIDQDFFALYRSDEQIIDWRTDRQWRIIDSRFALFLSLYMIFTLMDAFYNISTYILENVKLVCFLCI